jgi:perosamine synthetase
MIPYGRQEINDADIEAVAAALRAPMLTQGPTVGKFEEALAAAVGARYAVAVNSGTAALHAAYFAAGIGAGQDVLTSPITFVATVNGSYYLGGGAVLSDVDADTVMLDPATLPAPAESQRVKVLTPVHFGGQVADMSSISKIAASRRWTVVEDAAHALGASYTIDGQEYRVGACAHSSMCCFSFHPVKHVTTGEGGAVTTNDPALRDKLLRFRTHGITRAQDEMESLDGPWYYEQHDLGFNYRITDVQCALGMSQLGRLEEFVERRRAIAAAYDDLFAGNEHVVPTAVPRGSRGSYHLYVVRVPARVRRAVFERLRAEGIGVNVHYIPLHRQPYQRKRLGAARFPQAESYYERAITIPMFPALTDSEVSQVAESVMAAVRRCLR